MDFEDALWTVLGAVLILLMVADVFHTLLYPHGSGPVCRTIVRGFWLLSRVGGRASTIAAPLAMAAVIGAWAGLAVMGWALLYLPHLREGFVYESGVPRRGDFAEAVYISMVTLSTVGYGEIVAGDARSGSSRPYRPSPASGCSRLLSPGSCKHTRPLAVVGLLPTA